MSSSHAPITVEMALFLVFRRSANRITAGLAIDPYAIARECKSSTMLLSLNSGTAYDQLLIVIKAMNPALTALAESPGSIGYVRGIRPIRLKVTDLGHRVSAERQATGRGYLDYDAVKNSMREMR